MAQFVGDVFGLNAVYDKQLENIANGNFASWSESATYGYFAGGQPPATGISSIDRLDFFTEVLSSPGTPLGRNTNEFDGFSSSLYGYFGGGDTPGGPSDTRVDRLDFSTETISNPGNYLSPGRQIHAATSSTSYGYFGGGDNSGTLINTITRLDFSSETVSNPGNNLPTARFALAATESSSYGYFGGGDGTSGGGTPLSTVTRLDFSNDSISSPGNPLTVQRTESATISNVNSYGYFGGGNPTYESVALSTSIIRLDFSNEISVTLENFGLTNRKEKLSGVYGNNSGYFAGGLSGIPRAVSNTIERFNFSNETLSTIPSVLSIAKNSMGALSGGQSTLRGKRPKTYAYFSIGPINSTSDLIRLDFSNDSFTTLSAFPTGREDMSTVSNNTYGYFAGGNAVASGSPSPDERSSIFRLDFLNETVSTNSNRLPSVTARLSSTQDNSYGYFSGGSSISTVIVRLDFYNESCSLPNKNTPTPGIYRGSVSSKSYGYFSGGFQAGPTILSLVTRLDFSNESISTITPLPEIRYGQSGSSTDSYGYLFGGYKFGPSPAFAPPGATCTVSRLDFSNDTISNRPNIPYINSFAATVYNDVYAYITGGVGSSPSSPLFNVSSVIRFDFSNETSVTQQPLTSRLPSNDASHSGLSNSN